MAWRSDLRFLAFSSAGRADCQTLLDSGGGLSPLRAQEPYVNLSIHTALEGRTQVNCFTVH